MSRSQSVEDYLKTIYKLESETPPDKGVSTSRLAEEMGVANASVTNMLKRLSDMKMVNYESYYGSRLTEAGLKIALEIIRHHRLLELYLKEILGYSWDEVHDEAEKLEHHISEQFEDKIAELLNHPTEDPHGDPIPTKDGKMPKIKLKPLHSVSFDTPYIIRRVKNQNPELLRYLEKQGLIPGVKVKVLDKEPFDGPVKVKVENDTVTIANNIAEDIFVVKPDAI
ncbi:metal-dependent transcriptional regulator [Rhodohalobacter sulfatireducens]|uniref:Transcriptional regulator MntR n=1 Tax=Rhodohalobacter sulfatireducens TaxID=2911366 RepID=A0ABS9KBL8_9BACT|nr:metal-dependent transcriptional regulator [Rhodohalobacter sulfatireducens]MCG2588251.1 metal-dependent transcriptional regulator [Rhodohalobacter sulfatireducens]MDR9364821.1 metal-dependent transcriptional regulator [Balneolaceae bacterium]